MIPAGVSNSQKSNFLQSQVQSRTIAELDDPQPACQAEPAGLRLSQLKGLWEGRLLGATHQNSPDQRRDSVKEPFPDENQLELKCMVKSWR